MWVLGEEQVHDASAELDDLRDVRVHPHPLGYGRGAGGGISGQRAIFAIGRRGLRLDDAHAAGAEGLQVGVVAQVRDVHAGVHGRLDYHGPGLRLDLDAIYSQGYLI